MSPLAPCFSRLLTAFAISAALPRNQRLGPDVADLVRQHPGGDRRNQDQRPRERDLLRFGIGHVQQGDLDIRPRLPLQQDLRVGQRHVARGNALDALDQVTGADARLAAGESRQRAHHRHVTVALGQHHAHVALVGVLVLQVLLVLIGVEVAGERVDRFQQPVDRARASRSSGPALPRSRS